MDLQKRNMQQIPEEEFQEENNEQLAFNDAQQQNNPYDVPIVNQHQQQQPQYDNQQILNLQQPQQQQQSQYENQREINQSKVQKQYQDEDQSYQQQIIKDQLPYQQQQQVDYTMNFKNEIYQQQQQQMQYESVIYNKQTPSNLQSQNLSQQLIFSQEKLNSQQKQSQIQNNNEDSKIKSDLRVFNLDIDELREEIFQQNIKKYYTNLLESALKKLQILIAAHPEIEKDCDFVYHKGSSISYFTRQNLTDKSFFSQYGNYAAYEKSLKILNLTVNIIFEKLSKIYQDNQLKKRIVFSIDKKVLENIDQQFQKLMQDPSKIEIRRKMDEQKISNEMAYLFIGMYHDNCEKIETKKYLESFKQFVKEVELREITEEELKKIKLLISDKRTYYISFSQINNFFNGYWTSPTDFEYLEIPQINMEDWPQKKVTLQLIQISPDFQNQKNLLFNQNKFIEVGVGNSIEIYPNNQQSIIFGRQTKSTTNNFFIFSAEQKLVSRHQFQFKYNEDQKFKLQCISTSNPTSFKINQQKYILREGMIFFIGRSQGFLVKSVKHGKTNKIIKKREIIDLFNQSNQESQNLLEKRKNQSLASNFKGLVQAQINSEKNYQNSQSQLIESQLPMISEYNIYNQSSQFQIPFIEIMGLSEKQSQYKTDFAWQIKTFYSNETNCILLGRAPECQLQFEHPEVQPRHAEIIYDEEFNYWMLSSPFEHAETFISMKSMSQIKNKENSQEFDIKEGMVIAVECNEFQIKNILREQPID